MGRLAKWLVGVGLVFYFIFLVVSSIPGAWASYFVVKSAPGVQLFGVSGTVWKGKAAKASVNIDGLVVDLGELRWKLKPLNLLGFSACANITSAKLSMDFCRALLGARNTVENFQFDFPASYGNRLLREANFDGNASLNLRKAVVSDQGLVDELDGNFSWRNSRIKVEGRWFALGDYAANLSGNGEGAVRAEIFDQQAPIKVNLIGLIGVSQPPKVQGVVRLTEQAPPEAQDVLSIFAVPTDDGGFEVKFPL